MTADDPLNLRRMNAFLEGVKKENHEDTMRVLKADAGIILALAGWTAYKRAQVQRKGR